MTDQITPPAPARENIGAQMANVMFNLAQKAGHTLTYDDAALFDRLRKQWDAATPAPAQADHATVEQWEAALTTVMPSDFKDWHQNSRREWPNIAAHVIGNLRQREDEAWATVERLTATAPAPATGKPGLQVEQAQAVPVGAEPVSLDAAVRLGLEYAREALATHDQQFANHPATALERGSIVADIATMEASLAPVAEHAEPVAWMWQHDETGRTGFVEASFDREHWAQHNPRLRIIRPLYTAPQAPQQAPAWRAVVAHAVSELEELDDETAQAQAESLRNLLESAPDLIPEAGSMVPRPPNAAGETQCIVRWMVETPAGWLGAWNREAFAAFLAPQQAECPECIEPARLLGAGSEREAALTAEIEQLRRANEQYGQRERWWNDKMVDLEHQVASHSAGIARLQRICTSIHDGLLRGDDDRELIDLAAQAWDGGQAPQQAGTAARDLSAVIAWLENGCDPKEAAKELRAYQQADHVPDAGEMVPQQADFDKWMEDRYPDREDRQSEFRMTSVRNLMREAFECGFGAGCVRGSEAALASLGMGHSTGWQPIETAPRDGTEILLGRAESEDLDSPAISVPGYWQEGYEDGVDYMGCDSGFVDSHHQDFSGGRSFGPESHRYAPNQPTHWMPLPAAPVSATQVTSTKGGE